MNDPTARGALGGLSHGTRNLARPETSATRGDSREDRAQRGRIEKAWERAQKAAFAASDAGEADDYAEACYSLLQWLAGYQDDPTLDLEEE